MQIHFDQELGQLREALIRMSALAEGSVAAALKALLQRNEDLAVEVQEEDQQLDRLEMEIDEKAMALLALRQPMAKDLRFITMTMKIAAELERIGDQAVNIARSAAELSREPVLKPMVDIPRMADLARSMIRDSFDALVYAKPDLARDVVRRDSEVDTLNRQLHRELTSFMIEDPHTITRALNLMSVSRNIERVADHATNIAEEIVYLYEALDIRHGNAAEVS